MKKTIYQGIKLALGTIIAIAVADFFKLSYSTTAGIIALLSILSTRKETYSIALKRFFGSALAMALSAITFNFLGHNLIAFGIFMIVFVLLTIKLNIQSSISVGTVLVTHIYTLKILNLEVVLNEILILMIGMLVGIMLNIHMISEEKEINEITSETENLIKNILYKMQAQLLNKCSIDEQIGLLDNLDKTISKGFKLAISYEQNNPLKNLSYYPNYFRMRREQYFMLKYMEFHFNKEFITVKEAKLLSDFTELLAKELNEYNDGKSLLKELSKLRTHYKKRELPKNREEFENRATLYQYMNDLELFIKYKSNFSKRLNTKL
jgi:uncharacterized membrane protein YgaE (UPF0421/DUF939 family)